MTQIYLAGPIVAIGYEKAMEWRNEVENWFNCLPLVEIRNPMRGFQFGEAYTDNEVIVRDKMDIANCDLILVNWPEQCMSNGTTMEILYAHERGIPVIFVGEWANRDVWLRYHATKIFYDLKGALDYIERMFI